MNQIPLLAQSFFWAEGLIVIPSDSFYLEVASSILQHLSAILDEWEIRLSSHQEHASKPWLKDFSTDFLQSLTQTLRSEKTTEKLELNLTSLSDFNLEEMILEFQILREVILDHLKLDLPEMKIEKTIAHFFDKSIRSLASQFPKSIQESEEKFRQLAESLTYQVVHIMELNPQRISYVSPSYESVWKKTVSSLYEHPHSFIERIHPEDRYKIWEAMEQQNKGFSTSIEYRLLFEDGSIKWIWDSVTTFRNNLDLPYRATGIAEDITEGKLFESRLRESEASILEVANTLPQIVWKASPQGKINWFNDMWFHYTGLERHSHFNESQDCPMHPDDKKSAIAEWKKLLKNPKPFDAQYRFKRKSDSLYRWHLVRTVPIFDRDQKIMKWIGSNTDIHEQKMLVEKLQEERELRERFVSALTHDLRTPMTSAKMGAQLLARKSKDPEVIKTINERIISNLNRADRMIRDLLDANHIKAGEGIPISPQTCNPSKILEKVLTELQLIHGERLQVKRNSLNLNCYWDASAIERVVENLVGNAIKYGDSTSPILLDYLAEEQFALISVTNFGNPISEDDQMKLFEPYHRMDAAKDSGHHGWGIGLTIVKGIVEAHNGSIKVESSSQEGTTFLVKLPFDVREPSS